MLRVPGVRTRAGEGVCVSTRALPVGALAAGDTPLATDRLDLDPVPRAAGTARRFVREHAPELPEETEDSLLLLTSELVSNAVVHARTAIELSVVVTQRSVVVLVHDLDLATPIQDPYAGREGGWGLELVAALAEACAVTPEPTGGKTSWFRLSRGDVHAVLDGAAARAQSGSRDS
jgi:anti-sigma regulatory factor (Ser/Thr protein kinase)